MYGENWHWARIRNRAISKRGRMVTRAIFENPNNIYRPEIPTANRRDQELDFQDYLTQKHILKKGERQLQPFCKAIYK